jgi:hypothetical protein
MEGKTGKLILRIILVLVVLLLCAVGAALTFFAAWLHTYKVFTQKTLVAEIEVSPRSQSGEETTFDVTYREVIARSSLTSIFGSPAGQIELTDPQTFSMKGDEVRLGGQVVKLNDSLNLFGFKTIYKITRIESTYLDVDEAQTKEGAVYELNGGVDVVFKFYQENEQALSFLIDTAMGDYPGKNVQNQTVRYGLFVTEEGFLLDRL